MFARVQSVETAVPPHCLQQDDVAERIRALYGDSLPHLDRLMPVFANADIQTRYSSVPLDWYAEPHGFGEKNDTYISAGLDLLDDLATRLLDGNRMKARDVDGLVVVSTTGIATPSLDAQLAERMGMRSDLIRLPIFGYGCAGGVLGMTRTAELAKAYPGKRFLFLVLELCGLTFNKDDLTKSNLVATALFGDGAAGCLISTEAEGPAIKGGREHRWSDTQDIMGWDIDDSGFGIRLKRSLPDFARAHLEQPITSYLRDNQLDLDHFDSFAVHPGGAKVLQAIDDALALPQGALNRARSVLNRYGNMSAATILFVLRDILDAEAAERTLMVSMGPGFSLAIAHLEREA